MHSSYSGYGYSSLDSDVEDMTRALAFLKQHRRLTRSHPIGRQYNLAVIRWNRPRVSTRAQYRMPRRSVLHEVALVRGQRISTAMGADSVSPQNHSLPQIRGCILQGAVSDRDAVDFAVKESEEEQESLLRMRTLAMVGRISDTSLLAT